MKTKLNGTQEQINTIDNTLREIEDKGMTFLIKKK